MKGPPTKRGGRGGKKSFLKKRETFAKKTGRGTGQHYRFQDVLEGKEEYSEGRPAEKKKTKEGKGVRWEIPMEERGWERGTEERRENLKKQAVCHGKKRRYFGLKGGVAVRNTRLRKRRTSSIL